MLTITQRANDYIIKSGITEIRFGVKTNKGCAGFEYIWKAGQYNGGDYTLWFNNDYKIFIAKEQKKYIENCVIDLKDVDDGTGYKICFDNEKVEVKCGCGESLDFPDDIHDIEVWEPNIKVSHIYDATGWGAEDINNLLESNGMSDYKETYVEKTIDSRIETAGDTVKRVDPKKLSEKYRNWRK